VGVGRNSVVLSPSSCARVAPAARRRRFAVFWVSLSLVAGTGTFMVCVFHTNPKRWNVRRGRKQHLLVFNCRPTCVKSKSIAIAIPLAIDPCPDPGEGGRRCKLETLFLFALTGQSVDEAVFVQVRGASDVPKLTVFHCSLRPSSGDRNR
jgi:hypothetical protein